jgi:hypothetical protein
MSRKRPLNSYYLLVSLLKMCKLFSNSPLVSLQDAEAKRENENIGDLLFYSTVTRCAFTTSLGRRTSSNAVPEAGPDLLRLDLPVAGQGVCFVAIGHSSSRRSSLFSPPKIWQTNFLACFIT